MINKANKYIYFIFLTTMFLGLNTVHASTPYKWVSVTWAGDQANDTKKLRCFDTRVKDYGEKASFEHARQTGKSYIGVVDDDKCKSFKKIYSIGTYETYNNPVMLACYEYDITKKLHKKVVRSIDQRNSNVSPCKEKLFYSPRRISTECGNHANCKTYSCHLDVKDEAGNLLITRRVYDNDVIKLSCDSIEFGHLITKSSKCYEFDLKSKGKHHFFQNNYSCGDGRSKIAYTSYEWSRPSDSFIKFLSSFAMGKSCYEIDPYGGHLYKKEVSDTFCEKKYISNQSRYDIKERTSVSIDPANSQGASVTQD